MSLSELSIRRPVFAWMLMASLIIFGALSFKRMGISQMPDVDFPVVNVSLNWPGAAPGVMETQVVDPVEDAVMEIQGIRSVSSTSRQSSANVTIEFELDRNIDGAIQEVQTRIAQAARVLPTDLDPPSIRKSNPEDQPIIWLTLTSDGAMALNDQMMFARNVLFDQFSTIKGVGDIVLGGYVEPNLRVWVSGKKLAQYQLTALDVLKGIQQEHAEIPAGRIESREREYNVRLLGEARTPREFSTIPLNQRGGAPIYRIVRLGEVARVEEGLADVRRISRFNGQTAIGLGILKQHGSNAVEVVRSVRERLKEVAPNIPKGLTLSVRMDNATFIKQSVDELNFTLLLSALLTSVVCFLFLGSWTSTFNVLMAIPTSIVGTFIVIYFFKFTLNTFTLLGLSLAIGIVVDDAIMMLENIVRHGAMGKNKFTASLDGSREITFAALAATIAIVAIFLPVVFMKGVIGRYFYQYGITVTVAVLLSLLEALTLTPMRCSRFLPTHGSGKKRLTDAAMDRLAVIYEKILRFALAHRLKTVAAAFLFFAVSFHVAKRLPSEMIPAQDQSRIMLRFKAPVGSSLSYVDERIKQAEKYLGGLPEVTGMYSTVGGFGGDSVNEAQIFVDLKDARERKLSQSQVIDKIRNDLKKQLKGIRMFAQDMSLRGFTSSRGFPVEFTLQGPDWEKLATLATEMMEQLQQTGLFADLNSDYQVGNPEVQLLPDRNKASAHGIKLTDVVQTINTLVGGSVFGATTRYTKGGHRYDIRVRLESEERTQSDQLGILKIRNDRGELVPLSELVTMREQPSLQVISRRNRERAISIFSNVAPGHSQQEALNAVTELARKSLSGGYHVVMTGSAQTFRESFESLIIALLLGILVSYMVLASQFNSFIHPVSVLMALPFSICGAFIGLSIAHQSINMFSMIGLILLMGIVKKNSILLVDFTNQKRGEGKDVMTALLEACPVRLRPILMTSVATVAGAIPVAVAVGPGSETRIPMAVSVIGGVIASTILTLFVVPCVYSLIARYERPS